MLHNDCAYSQSNMSVHLLHLSQQSRDERGLASSNMTHHCHQLTWLDVQVDTGTNKIQILPNWIVTLFTICNFSSDLTTESTHELCVLTYSLRLGLSIVSHVNVPSLTVTESFSGGCGHKQHVNTSSTIIHWCMQQSITQCIAQ